MLTDFLEQVLQQTDDKIVKLMSAEDGDSPDDATKKLILRASLEIKYADDLSQSKAVNKGNHSQPGLSCDERMTLVGEKAGSVTLLNNTLK